MTKATTARFADFVLEVEWVASSGTYARVCGLTDVQFNRTANVDSTEVPDCDDESKPYIVEKEVRSIELSVSASGVWARESHEQILDWFYGASTKLARIGHLAAGSGDTQYEGGPCLLTAVNNSRSKGQKVTASLEFAFAGYDGTAFEEAAFAPWDGGSPVPDFALRTNALTVSGSVSKDTTNKRFGAASFLGAGGWINVPDSDPGLSFTDEDFTVEMWVRAPSEPVIGGLFSKWGGSGDRSQRLQYDPTTNQFIWVGSSDGIATDWTAAFDLDTTGALDPAAFWDGSFRHVAVNRRAGVVTVYVEGVAGATTAAIGSGTIYEIPTTPIVIGARHNTDTTPRNGFEGNIDEVRVSIGRARYTGAFTPRTKAFPHSTQGDPYFSTVKLLADFE